MLNTRRRMASLVALAPALVLALAPVRVAPAQALASASTSSAANPGTTAPSAGAGATPARRSTLARHGAVPFASGAPTDGDAAAAVRGATTAPDHAALIRPSATITARLDYYGGPVIANAHTVPVVFGTGTFVAGTTTTPKPSIHTFLGTLLASPAIDWLSEYDTKVPTVNGTAGTGQHIGRGTTQVPVTITPSSSATLLYDGDIQAELTRQINAGKLPKPVRDASGYTTTVYPIFLPAGRTVCIDGSTCSLRRGGFCAYHNAFLLGSDEVLYTVEPYLGSTGGACGPGDDFQVTTAVLAHEVIEAITDPLGPVAQDLAPPLAWYDQDTSALGEIGDICADAVGTLTGTDGVTYVAQGEWSNQLDACIIAKGEIVSPPPADPGVGAALDIGSPVARLVDTRTTRAIGADGVLQVAAGSDGANAVVLNVTATRSTASTYLTVWPCDVARPIVSNLNVEPGATVANLVTVQLAADGSVCIYNHVGSVDVIVDRMAGYRSVSGAVAAGRFVAAGPTRVVDTRTTTPLAARSPVTVDLAPAGVPANALAVVLTVTAVDARGAGFWSVWPSGPWPGTSSLNIDRSGQTRANQVVVPVEGGTVQVMSQVGGHMVLDVGGWFTGTGGAAATTGLFHPRTPARLLDTRNLGTRVDDVDVSVAGAVVAPATAVVLDVAAVNAAGPGFVTAYPAGSSRPDASNLNYVATGAAASHVTSGVGAGGVALHSHVPADLVVDLFGWYS